MPVRAPPTIRCASGKGAQLFPSAITFQPFSFLFCILQGLSPPRKIGFSCQEILTFSGEGRLVPLSPCQVVLLPKMQEGWYFWFVSKVLSYIFGNAVLELILSFYLRHYLLRYFLRGKSGMLTACAGQASTHARHLRHSDMAASESSG